MTRAQKVIHDPKLLYISWLEGKENGDMTKWVDQFYEKVTASSVSLSAFEARRTGDDSPGAIKFKNIDELLERVTDLVGVMTNKYAIEIKQKGSSPDAPELNRFFRLKLQDKSDLQSRRAWITPLYILPLDTYSVEGVALKNKEYSWLVVLKDKGKRFPWPEEKAFDDEIAHAVMKILGLD